MVLPVSGIGEAGADHIGHVIGRIAERTGLPVDQRSDPSVGVEENIVEAHVAVGNGLRRRFVRDIAGESGDQFLPEIQYVG